MRRSTWFLDHLAAACDKSVQLRFLAEAAYFSIRMGDHSRAARILRGLRHVAPNDPLPLIGLAELDMRNGEWQSAADRLRQAAEQPNTDRLALAYCNQLLGQCLLGMRDGRAAATAFNQAIALDGLGPVGQAVRHLCVLLTPNATASTAWR